MEPRIRVLPPELADQIAAGEVVERPASVVKELCENAIDAGARRIDVDVEGGGRRLVRVVDDGCGMTPEEARLALKRHATSKLASVDELFAIRTMGFRGEALPSIAAVSRLALTTRMAGAVGAFRVEVEAGVETDARDAGAAVGTTVEVRDLLWNVPARLKFLKADATETAHVTEAVTRLAMAHPAVHVRLRHAGREALDLPPHASLLERARAILGRRLAARVFEAEGEEAGVRVRAFLLPPDEAQATSRGVTLFVGARCVRDRGLLHAVVMGYGELVPHGRYPAALVFVEPPPGAVDVNVHPQKAEVRFARPQEVYAAVRHALARALAKGPWVTSQAKAPSPVSMYAVAEMAPPAPARLSDAAVAYADRQEQLLGGGFFTHQREPARAPVLPLAGAAVAPATTATATATTPATSGLASAGGFFGRLEYLGQLDRTYLVCEAGDELVLIDQHAAHERVAFQRLREAHKTSGPRVQQLLFPRAIDLEPTQAGAAEAHRDTLASIGFELEAFGGRAWALKAAPVDLRPDDVEPTLRELLDDLAEREASRAASDRLDHLFATVACHSVVRAGDMLSRDEALALLEGMDQVDFRAHCPHGRPVLLRISIGEIARRFGRT